MRAEKVILHSVLSTLISIATLFLLMILALCFLFPSTMMHITYDLGMDGSSVRNAKRAYAMYGQPIRYIAHATEVSIGLEDFEKIAVCGEKLIADEEFADYCKRRDEEVASDGGYRQYVCAQVCLAKYELGEKAQAVEKAKEWLMGAFPKNNALAAVGLRAAMKGDQETVQAVLAKMNEIDVRALSDADEEYRGKILRALQNG